MEIERFEGTGRMSRAVRFSNTLYLCGQTSRDGGDVKAQTAASLAKVEELLDKYGSDKDHIRDLGRMGERRPRARPRLRQGRAGKPRHPGRDIGHRSRKVNKGDMT